MAKTLHDESAVAVDGTEPAVEPTRPTLGAQRTPRRRTTRLDSVLAEAKETAYRSVLEITPEETVGTVHHIRGEEDRLSTHLFECALPGYRGWFWFSTVARAPRSKKATVCEVGLLPGDDALLAPEWIPWADRLRPEDVDEDAEGQDGGSDEEAEGSGAGMDNGETEEASAEKE
ncbi:DUF3027 domain-containing protein [Rothia sp. HC945]|uniref:DUF3027 domain-containing protein n=1 Tax=Rothia sp. HC945 TaxID=3171170 RepID=UPI00264ED022|nr:DUF3027 domain-containing protein [Kocuria sp.]MDN5616589.1 DUF3027 domain-containing protein [Kocuria sp.]